jgi:hypothetical protein
VAASGFGETVAASVDGEMAVVVVDEGVTDAAGLPEIVGVERSGVAAVAT